MPVIFTKGDLLNTPGIHAFAHTCDLTGAMTAGIWPAFKKRWPAMAEDFARQAAARPLQMGDTFVWPDGTDTVFSRGPRRARRRFPAGITRAEPRSNSACSAMEIVTPRWFTVTESERRAAVERAAACPGAEILGGVWVQRRADGRVVRMGAAR